MTAQQTHGPLAVEMPPCGGFLLPDYWSRTLEAMETNSPRHARWFNFGVLSLVMTVINAVLLAWVIVAAGDGVDSGLGVAALVLLFTLPVLLISLVIGMVAIRKRSGNGPAIVAVALNATALAVSVYGFLSTQVF